MTTPADILGRHPITKKADPNKLAEIDQSDDWKGEGLIKRMKPVLNSQGKHMASVRRYG